MRALTLLAVFFTAAIQPSPAQGLQQILKGTGASAIVLDVSSGKVLARYGDTSAAAAPGSTLKPFVLETALQTATASPSTTIHCTGALVIRGHNLACAHPRDITILDARQALSESCNTWFATIARRLTSAALLKGLRSYGLQPTSALSTPDDRALLALGVQGIVTSPQQLALAYRKLALELSDGHEISAPVLRDGLLQSVLTGMAHAARVDGLTLAGKTGTADDPGGSSHGWFAGITFTGATPAKVLVIYLPGSNGNDAALLAHRYLLQERAR